MLTIRIIGMVLMLCTEHHYKAQILALYLKSGLKALTLILGGDR